MLCNISIWNTFEHESFYMQVDSLFNHEKLFWSSFWWLNAIKQAICSICSAVGPTSWAPGQLQKSQKQFLEKMNFTHPALRLAKPSLCGSGGVGVGRCVCACNDPEKENGDLPRFDYVPIQFSICWMLLQNRFLLLLCSGIQTYFKYSCPYYNTAKLLKEKKLRV